MTGKILICTDLDRTLVPNGPEPESAGARVRFGALAARPEVTLAYVSGRHLELVEDAITAYGLPQPDFVVADVGTTIYGNGKRGCWRRMGDWEEIIAVDWAGRRREELMAALDGIAELSLQDSARQAPMKLSYYLPMECNRERLAGEINRRLASLGVNARLVWSIDGPAGVGLLDVLPARASKFHAVEYLMEATGFELANTLFCGDSGNDLEVLTSPVPSVLVANSSPDIKAQAREMAQSNGCAAELYIASGGLFGMNGNYSAGMLEGIAHYHPGIVEWMTLRDAPTDESAGEAMP